MICKLLYIIWFCLNGPQNMKELHQTFLIQLTGVCRPVRWFPPEQVCGASVQILQKRLWHGDRWIPSQDLVQTRGSWAACVRKQGKCYLELCGIRKSYLYQILKYIWTMDHWECSIPLQESLVKITKYRPSGKAAVTLEFYWVCLT